MELAILLTRGGRNPGLVAQSIEDADRPETVCTHACHTPRSSRNACPRAQYDVVTE